MNEGNPGSYALLPLGKRADEPSAATDGREQLTEGSNMPVGGRTAWYAGIPESGSVSV